MKITQKIMGVTMVKSGNVQSPAPMPQPDVNPLYTRIEDRPNEPLDAVIDKVQYSTQQGKKKVYVAVSFLEVEGRINGETVMIERPIEIFLPAGQTEDDGQWIVATMRSLSLAARGGYLTRALQDMRQVPWTKGPVRFGTRDYGNGKVVPIHHPSEAAAIAYAIQRILYRKGFVDIDGNQVPALVLAKHYANQRPDLDELNDESQQEPMAPNLKLVETSEKAGITPGITCPQCGGANVRHADGCDTCADCGHSNCS